MAKSHWVLFYIESKKQGLPVIPIDSPSAWKAFVREHSSIFGGSVSNTKKG